MFDADAGICLRERGRGQANQSHTAMSDRGRKPYGVKHRPPPMATT